jgi:hypothetical protein
MDSKTTCLIVIFLFLVVLIASYLVVTYNAKQTSIEHSPGTTIEYSEKIEVEGGYERHEVHEKRWSFGGPLPKKTELKDKK